MKPYSKKYLTLALAGVLAASIPVSAFANTEDASATDKNETTVEQPAKPGSDNESGNQGTGETGKTKTGDKENKVDKDKKDKEDKKQEEKIKELENKIKDLEKDKEKKKEEDRKKYGNISITNVRYDGKYIKGETSAYAKIYVQEDGYKEFRRAREKGEADKNGNFSIRYDIEEGKSVTIFADDGDRTSRSVEVKNDNYKNIKGTRVDATGLNIVGKVLTGTVKDHAFDYITVYLDGEELGKARANKDGFFSISLNKSIDRRDLDDLRFYTDKKEVENKKFKITEALEGQKLVKGTANTDDEITVYDASGKKISNTYVNNAGVFTAFLDRALIAGETIKLEAKDKDKNITKIEYKVTKNAVEEVKAISYIKGYPDGTFKPQANVTRAEAAQMFATLLNGGTNFGTSQATKFSDASDDWYSKAVNYVVGKGLISGYPNGTFKPNDSITRAEFAQMISGYIKNEKAGSSDFQDVKDHWAKDAIDKLNGNKNVSGYPDGSFKPNAKITRAEAVTILNSVFNRNTNKNSLNNVNTSSLNKFSDVKEGFWAYYNIIDAANTHDRERLNSTSEVDMWK
ncbi:S-layer homology domain-containing protein [Peptoniphilus harei]|uniref:S-layer homology domain-containing protein n=1 Tax=Peptoniphilus harei TaxID=54005 RepID=UPI0029107C1C|nr:S-layer homology domain-containing protein [Peptoniphilus harei]MDU5417187.1 S-layer homology domain-containing protein [Peptoniphilus harei]